MSPTHQASIPHFWKFTTCQGIKDQERPERWCLASSSTLALPQTHRPWRRIGMASVHVHLTTAVRDKVKPPCRCCPAPPRTPRFFIQNSAVAGSAPSTAGSLGRPRAACANTKQPCSRARNAGAGAGICARHRLRFFCFFFFFFVCLFQNKTCETVQIGGVWTGHGMSQISRFAIADQICTQAFNCGAAAGVGCGVAIAVPGRVRLVLAVRMAIPCSSMTMGSHA